MARVIDYSTGLINPTVNIRVAVRNITGVCFCSLQLSLMDQKNPSISRLWPGDRSIQPCQSTPSTDMIYGFGCVWLAQVLQRRQCAAANKWWCQRPTHVLISLVFWIFLLDTFMTLLWCHLLFCYTLFQFKSTTTDASCNTSWQRPWDPSRPTSAF